jgi:hypothetical protein
LSSILNSSIKGSLGCSVECMSNHTDVVAPFLLIQHHLHTSYKSTFAKWSPCAKVEGNVVVDICLDQACQTIGEVSSTQSITPFPQKYMLHWEILSLTDRRVLLDHLEKRRRARVNNHFESEFKLESRGEKGSKSKDQIIFANN